MERADTILKAYATPKNIVRRDFEVNGRAAVLLFNPDLTDAFTLREIVEKLERARPSLKTLDTVIEHILNVTELETIEDINLVNNRLLAGDACLMVTGLPGFVIINARKWDKRAVAEPPTETVMRGPREGFIEDLKTNLSLIERRLKTPALAIEKLQIGRLSSTTVALMYVSTVAERKLVDRIRKKLSEIDIDILCDSHYLEQLLDEHPHSVFHQTGITEKPDVVASKLAEGRVAIIADGSPMAITLPFLLIEDFHSSEDYYERSSFATFLRFLRYFSVILAVLLPGMYVAVQIYHYDIIPYRFLLTLMNAVKGTPFPPLVELFFVMLLFEIIREASVRMPRAVGMAMSIVGALVLGDTAVKAGLISSPSVMITALSSIALYTVPYQVGTMSLLRLLFTAVGGVFGIYGLIVSSVFTIFYLATLDSYGAPYLAPFAPLVLPDLKDSLLKKPMSKMRRRPKSVKNINGRRQSF